MISYLKFLGHEGWKYHEGFSVLSNMDLLPEVITNACWSPIIWDHGKRSSENFTASFFMVLDFDEPGDETLEEINRIYSDHKRIIATTKSHQLYKKGAKCDRFRLIIPWSKPILDLETYRYNLRLALNRFPWADRSCLDGARFFFPSPKILYVDRDSEFCWDVATPHDDTNTFNYQTTTGVIPPWCLNFINNGAVYNGSRNMKVYAVSLELFRAGFTHENIKNLVMRAPIDWNGVNLTAILKSAEKKSCPKTKLG